MEGLASIRLRDLNFLLFAKLQYELPARQRCRFLYAADSRNSITTKRFSLLHSPAYVVLLCELRIVTSVTSKDQQGPDMGMATALVLYCASEQEALKVKPLSGMMVGRPESPRAYIY